MADTQNSYDWQDDIPKEIAEGKTVLDLFGHWIGEKGATILCRELKNNTTITKLDLGDNGINFKETSLLAPCFEKNKILQILDFTNNYMGDDAVILLCESLKKNKSIKEINLKNNTIFGAGADAILNLLQQNSNIIFMFLDDYHYISKDKLEKIERMLFLNTQWNIGWKNSFENYIAERFLKVHLNETPYLLIKPKKLDSKQHLFLYWCLKKFVPKDLVEEILHLDNIWFINPFACGKYNNGYIFYPGRLAEKLDNKKEEELVKLSLKRKKN